MDVVTIGETMALFTPNRHGHMRYSHQFSRKFAGAESNFAIGLTRLGHKAGWISRVGNDEFGKAMLSFIRGEGVDVSQVNVDHSANTGLFFKEFRTNSEIKMTYYRKGSAASRMAPEDLDETYISKAKYLHITGITPALSKSCCNVIMEAIKIAQDHDVKIIFDPNLRKSLWEEDAARKILLEVTALAHIVLPGVDEGEFIFDTRNPEEIGEKCLELGCEMAVVKIGSEGAWYFNKDEKKHVPGFKIDRAADPVGAGDGFAAGFVSGLLDQLSVEKAVQRGNQVGSIVVQVEGDVEGLPDKEELSYYQNSAINDVTR